MESADHPPCCLRRIQPLDRFDRLAGSRSGAEFRVTSGSRVTRSVVDSPIVATECQGVIRSARPARASFSSGLPSARAAGRVVQLGGAPQRLVDAGTDVLVADVPVELGL